MMFYAAADRNQRSQVILKECKLFCCLWHRKI